MLRYGPAVILALWACGAAAALTAEDALRIAREANVPGLRALVAQRDQGVLFRATQSWNFGGSRTLSEPLEALIVENYADPAVQRPLVTLIAKDLENYERYPKYRSRRLFDLLYADLKAGKETHHYALRIIATDQAVDSDLAALLPVLDPAAANEIVMFLGKRKYAPALPALQALQTRIPLERDVNGMLGRVNWAYLQIGTPAAMQALYARLAALGQSKDERAGFEVAGIVDALLAVGGPDDWRAARVPPQYANAQKKLDAALADPAQAIARREERERQDAVYRAQAEFGREKRRLVALRTTEPKRYAAEMRAFLDRQDAKRNPELWREYLQLAAFARFELRQPDEAIATYQRAEAAMPAQPLNMVALNLADTYRFDKRDAARAVQQYRRVTSNLPAGGTGQEAMLAAGIKQWLEHEIAYVERGKRFSGAISRADMGTAQLWLMVAANQGEAPVDPRLLARLPASQLQLGRALPAALEVEPREMLAFFDKHDPAGYLTAGILGAASLRNPSPYVKAAAETFYRERGIQGGPNAKPDPRYASPEKTWGLFLAAGKKGDAAGMLDCLTPEVQSRFQDLFKRMSRDELRKMSESFTGFAITSTYGEFSEAMVVRKQGERNMGGVITFVNDGGTWKIAEM